MRWPSLLPAHAGQKEGPVHLRVEEALRLLVVELVAPKNCCLMFSLRKTVQIHRSQ